MVDNTSHAERSAGFVQIVQLASQHVLPTRPTNSSLQLTFTAHCADFAMSLITHPCAVCGHTTTLWCSRCQSVWYCSPDHLQSVRTKPLGYICMMPGLTLVTSGLGAPQKGMRTGECRWAPQHDRHTAAGAAAIGTCNGYSVRASRRWAE